VKSKGTKEELKVNAKYSQEEMWEQKEMYGEKRLTIVSI